MSDSMQSFEKKFRKRLGGAWKAFNKKQSRRKNKKQKANKIVTPAMLRQKAYKILFEAIKTGHIVRRENCDLCGSDKRVEAHHTDYTKPLCVTWLCRSCHVDAHGWTSDPFY